jgi:hypothetical protein
MKKGTILVILYKRPEYTKQVLEALAAQPEIKDYYVLFQIDGCVKEVIDLAINFNATEKRLFINGSNAGCTLNVYMGLCNAFSMSDFVIVVEDDILVSHDFLKYIEWAKPYLSEDCRVISAFHKFEDCPEDKYNTIHYLSRWCGWGWATNRKHWEAAKQRWDWGETESWDLMIAKRYFWQRKTIMPYLSRTKNIGAENGTYTVSVEQHTREVLIHKWADSVPKDKLGEYVFQEEIPENEQIIWDESKEWLYADTAKLVTQ